jgi:hypothetical protein
MVSLVVHWIDAMSIRTELIKAMSAAHIGCDGYPVLLTSIYLDHKSYMQLAMDCQVSDLIDGYFQGIPVFTVASVAWNRKEEEFHMYVATRRA